MAAAVVPNAALQAQLQVDFVQVLLNAVQLTPVQQQRMATQTVTFVNDLIYVDEDTMLGMFPKTGADQCYASTSTTRMGNQSFPRD
jgi:hypothetical protein